MKYTVRIITPLQVHYFDGWNPDSRSVRVTRSANRAAAFDRAMAERIVRALRDRLPPRMVVSLIPMGSPKRNPGRAKVHTREWDDCVRDVQGKGRAVNAYAVCTASLGERKSVRPAHRRKKPARNAARGNPGKDTKRAARLYKEFHGNAPREMVRVTHDLPHAAVDVGRVDAIEYTTTRDGNVEHYRHDFDPERAPDLAAGANGYPLLFIGGKTTFTDRGIEDK